MISWMHQTAKHRGSSISHKNKPPHHSHPTRQSDASNTRFASNYTEYWPSGAWSAAAGAAVSSWCVLSGCCKGLDVLKDSSVTFALDVFTLSSSVACSSAPPSSPPAAVPRSQTSAVNCIRSKFTVWRLCFWSVCMYVCLFVWRCTRQHNQLHMHLNETWNAAV